MSEHRKGGMNTTERVGRVMTEDVLSIDVEDSAGTVLRLFAGYPIHHLPVVSGQKVVGVVSSADVMKLHAFLPKTGVPADEYLNQHISVDALMSKPAITVQPHQSVVDAAALMAKHGFHALPVVDGQDRLLGMVTTTDIMHSQLKLAPRPEIDSPAAGGGARDMRLTGGEFDRVFSAAKTAVDSGHDGQGIGAALLHLQRRLVLLERVMQLAERYLASGQDHSVHAALLKAVDQAKRTTSDGRLETPTALGLVGD